MAAGDVFAPVVGNVIPLKDINDGVFSDGILGQGCGIEPSEGHVYAPFDGTIVEVIDTKHAIGLTSDSGIEMLIHVGIDTVAMKGSGFATFVEAGDKVMQGQLLMDFDIEQISKKYNTVTAVLITNSDQYQKIEVIKTGASNKSDKIMMIS